MGKESLKPGVPDTLKGSYYINCAFAVSPELQCAPETRPSSNQETVGKDYSAFTEYTTPNAWPEEDVLPGFPERTEELCKLIVETAGLVARACDRFAIENVEDYTPGYLEEMVKGSMTTKGRLLHYFPSANRSDASEAETNGTAMEEAIQKADSSRDTDKAEDDWCATHTDHGCLTGLTSAMYVDETAHPPHFFSTSVSLSDAAHCESKRPSLPPLPELPMPPDHKTGLYIHSRSGAVTKVSIPKDCLAFQTGEALERITRGRFRAVPHFVRGVTPSKDNKLPGRKIARNTLAVFTQPNLWEMVDTEKGQDYAAFAREVVGSHY